MPGGEAVVPVVGNRFVVAIPGRSISDHVAVVRRRGHGIVLAGLVDLLRRAVELRLGEAIAALGDRLDGGEPEA